MTDIVRIAMWSGPRNISTALMRAWENRADTVVCDEPLYAFYLRETGLDHPARDAVLASQNNDWRGVVEELSGPLPAGKNILYQKHMAHHLCVDIDYQWLGRFRHAFLLRDPHAMLVSLAKVLPRVTLDDTGLPQQLRLFAALRAEGINPPVLDSKDVLEDPRGMLSRLCALLDVSFDPAMLSWPPGARESDGVWAPHWYAAVNASTGFQPFRPCSETLPTSVESLYPQCDDVYRQLYRHRIKA